MRLVVTYGLEQSNVSFLDEVVAVPAGDEVRDSLHTHEVVITGNEAARSLTVALLGQLYQLFFVFPVDQKMVGRRGAIHPYPPLVREPQIATRSF